MLVGDALCDGQTQPGPFGIAGDHRQKEPWQEILWHPGAVVAHLKRADQLVASATDRELSEHPGSQCDQARITTSLPCVAD